MDSRSPFIRALTEFWPADAWQVTSLVAVSGGADSVALLRGLAEIAPAAPIGRMIVVHLNHGTRGEDSDLDAGFVESLAANRSLPPPSVAVDRPPMVTSFR